MKIMQIVFLIIVISVLFSCEKQDDLYSVQNPTGTQIRDIISFKSISATQIDADSFSLCTITVKINQEADTPNRNVTFSVSGSASFTNGTNSQVVTANTEGLATISFKNPKVETVQLKSMVSTYSIDTTVNFKAVLPDDMILTADNYVLDGTSAQSAIITAKLFRNAGRGQVTDGAKVNYTVVAVDNTGGLNLVLQESFQYSKGQQVVFAIQNPFKITGRFNISANTTAADGSSIVKMIQIKIE